MTTDVSESQFFIVVGGGYDGLVGGRDEEGAFLEGRGAVKESPVTSDSLIGNSLVVFDGCTVRTGGR